ncbi:MAG: alpha/beta fold hydrolase [Gemmatimonadetes bacterium]|nr:alpha/beta fold hydrolase [Gemmatimonadota bacterium]
MQFPPSSLILGLLVVGILLLHVGLHVALRPRRIRESSSPAREGLAFREVSFRTTNGRALFGWFIPPPGSVAAPAIAMLHGWSSNAEVMLPLAEPLWRAGYGLLLFDARNHGRSEGQCLSSLPRFAEDLDHALDWLAWQPEVDPRGIAALGHSVGAGAALLVASRRNDVAAVVSVAAFCHPEAVMRRLLAKHRVPAWPIGWYVLRYVQFVIGHRFDAIAPCHTIRHVSCPVLLVHGMDDRTVPIEESRAIFAARRTDASELLVLAGGHDSFKALDQHIETLVGFLDRALERRREQGQPARHDANPGQGGGSA